MMPMEPGSTAGPPATQETAPGPVPIEQPEYRWYHKLSAILLVTFCLEIGLFLLFFPWSEYWSTNYFSSFLPEWRRYWTNTYFRGAVSGLGMANLYIALVEIFRLRRFARRR
ncbi:MAG TPA: hypothetical protein VG096_02635 [Bryobacteraceae bacterium]|jgi:hypothetical protein|nr:hypothetical protein [Bryobacteraceae bacterium]